MLGKLTCIAVVAACAPGCFLTQAGAGQLDLIQRARPIDVALADRRISDDRRRLLGEVWRIKAWGERMGLEPTDSYRKYVELDGEAVVWVVSACEPLAFTPKTWSFPIVGSFTYIAWFDEADAKRHAAELAEDGWEIYVRGAVAYSTGGWFDDPVRSTMLQDDSLSYLVNVILHESVHATVYVNGQSPFNESLASFIADRLTPRYLMQWHGSEARAEYHRGVKRSGRRRAVLHEASKRLEALYESEASDDDKRRLKAKIITDAESAGRFKGLNNARLVQYRTYDTGKLAFARLLDRCDGDWRRFVAAIGALDASRFAAPHSEHLESVIDGVRCG